MWFDEELPDFFSHLCCLRYPLSLQPLSTISNQSVQCGQEMGVDGDMGEERKMFRRTRPQQAVKHRPFRVVRSSKFFMRAALIVLHLLVTEMNAAAQGFKVTLEVCTAPSLAPQNLQNKRDIAPETPVCHNSFILNYS